jgi:hypothetical protein
MVPPSPEAFAARLRSLPPEQRARFVADLLSARGWQTDRDGCRITASAGDRTRHISVGRPRPDADVDEVVVVPSRIDRLASALPGHSGPAVGRADVTVVGPDDLHERLLYAIDRGRAATLYRDHFGATLAETGDGPRARSRRFAGAVLVLAALATAALLAGFGPGSGPLAGGVDRGPSGPDRGTVVDRGTDASPVTERTPTPRPDLLPAEVRDIDRLARAHGAVLGTGPARMHATFRGPRFLTGFDTRRSGYDPTDEVSIDVCAASGTRYHVVRQTAFGGTEFIRLNATFERFADGDFEYRRIRRDGDLAYGRQPVSEARNASATIRSVTRSLLFRYLNTTEREVATIRNDIEPRYRLVATGRPLDLDHAVDDYRAIAIVRPDGFVTDLQVSYVHPDSRALVQVSAEYDTPCDTVDAPDWYEEARIVTRRQP